MMFERRSTHSSPGCNVQKTVEVARESENVLIAQVKASELSPHEIPGAMCTGEPPVDDVEIVKRSRHGDHQPRLTAF
jgi:hypothetical protein